MPVDSNILAHLAASAYRNATERNRILAPTGWTQIATYPASGPSDDPVTGFSAAAYRGPGGEIVIAYAGTNVDSVLDNDWMLANAPAALGFFSPQVMQAARFYWQVLNRPDVGAANKGRITFTGHSLGGGLASLMAVYFDLPAATFDSAPFEASAFGPVLGQYGVAFSASGIADASWQQYRAAQAAGSLAEIFAQREAGVSHKFVTNEALAALRFQYSAIVGPELPLDSGRANAHASGTQLHSMLLAWAMLSNSDFADEIRKLPRLVALIDDGQLFGRKRTQREQDFFSLLLKFEQSTGMLTQFTGDVKDISGEFAAASATVSDALIALTIAHYYRMSNGFDAQLGEAVKNIVGGLEIAIGGAAWNDRGFVRTYELLREMVDLLSGGGADLARAWLKERLVIAESAALGFADTAGERDLVLGGITGDSIVLGVGDDYASGLGGSDFLDGGAGDDVLDGGADADTLDGGAGNDTLIGGAGDDLYRFSGAFGHDVIEDSDGLDAIEVDRVLLPESEKAGDESWKSDDGRFTYVFAQTAARGGTGTLFVLKADSANTIIVHSYMLGQLGIELLATPAAVTPPTRSFAGDFAKLTDASGNYVFVNDGLASNCAADPNDTRGPQPDVLYGAAPWPDSHSTEHPDQLSGGGGNNLLASFGGEVNVTLIGSGVRYEVASWPQAVNDACLALRRAA